MKNLIVLFCCLFPMCVYSASWNDVGNYNISWYSSDEDLYISTPEELAGVAYLVNNNFTQFQNQTLYLLNDIDLSGKTWRSIGLNNVFYGSIDGNGHKITGMTCDAEGSEGGFIGILKEATIRRLTIYGNLNSSTIGNRGVLANSATNCMFEDLKVIGKISLQVRSISTSTSWGSKFSQAGVVGYANKCSFTDVISNFSQNLIFGNASGSSCFGYIYLYAGSIVGLGGSDGNQYLRCEGYADFSNTINGYIANTSYSVTDSSRFYCGGIVGHDYSSKTIISSCYSEISINEGKHLTGDIDSAFFYTLGFGYVNGKLKNSVAVINNVTIKGHDYYWYSTGYHTNSIISDCGDYKPLTIEGCYINSDITKSMSKLRNNSVKIYGINTFTKNQMNTEAFLEELNFYAKLNFDGLEAWEIKNGKLALIHETYDDPAIESGIRTINFNVDDKIQSEYYNLNGFRVYPPLHSGLYIVKYGNDVNKILIK